MRFGIFYEHQMPRPWAEDAEEKLLTDALDQVELADSVGIDYVWEVEHHFLEEYSHSSAPEVFLAAASQRTQQIRLGPRHRADPARVQPSRAGRRADRDARPDLRRPGRVRHRRVQLAGRAGRRSASTARPSARSGRRPRRDHAHVRGGAVRGLRRPLHLDAAALASLPKPKQKPHPPLWVACSRRETILLAARARHRRAHVRLHRARAGEGVGGRVLRDHRSPTSACRPASP